MKFSTKFILTLITIILILLSILYWQYEVSQERKRDRDKWVNNYSVLSKTMDNIRKVNGILISRAKVLQYEKGDLERKNDSLVEHYNYILSLSNKKYKNLHELYHAYGQRLFQCKIQCKWIIDILLHFISQKKKKEDVRESSGVRYQLFVIFGRKI